MDLSVKAFRDLGYLQEVNRRVLHPLGLALFTSMADDGTEVLGGIEDHRGELAGVILTEEVDQRFRAVRVKRSEYIDEQWRLREPGRVEDLGFMVQPLDGG